MKKVRRILAAAAFGFASSSGPVALAQQTAIPDLSGRWVDDGRPVEIDQSGGVITARFIESPMCDPQDGSAPQPRDVRFEGSWGAGDTIRGQVSVCNYGEGWGSEIGIQMVDMWLVLSEDGASLAGELAGMDGWTAFSLSREACDPGLWEDYRRKEATALELLAYSAELMDARTADARGYWAGLMETTVTETPANMATDWAVERSKTYYATKLGTIFEDVSLLSQQQLAAASPGYAGAGAVGIASTIGTYAVIAEQLYRAAETVRQLEASHAAAREAFAQGADLLDSALADFRAATEQLEACRQEEDEQREAEEFLERAKALRDEWDLGTGLYRDAEGGLHDAAGALERAKEILSGLEQAQDSAAAGQLLDSAQVEIQASIRAFGTGVDRLGERLEREAGLLSRIEELLESADAEGPPVG